METQDDRIPVTLLTGFLGAGKTTLLNQVLRDPAVGRIAVIMNEFGEVGLDHDLIEEITEDTVLMHAGCLCCSIRGDLAKTLLHLLTRMRRGELGFDRVLIETTGVADPGPVLNTMVTDRSLAPFFRVDGVVTLADAATGPQTLDRQFEAVRQIAMADLIILSKTNLVTADERNAFEARLQAINGSAQRITAQYGRVPSGALFGLSPMRRSATSESVAEWLGSHATTGSDDRHDHRIQSASIEVSDRIPTRVFNLWLQTLMAYKGSDILRIKGVVHLEEEDLPLVFHCVQHIFEQPVPLTSSSGKDTTSRAVIIARDVEKADFEVSLNMLRMRPSELKKPVVGAIADTTEMPF